MSQLLFSLVKSIQSTLVPLFSIVIASTFILFVLWTLWSFVKDIVDSAKIMHKIPCSNCQYFTNDYRLKCSVNPTEASTENAINCQDYRRVSEY